MKSKLKSSYYASLIAIIISLFGIIVKQWADGKETFLCYVFEGDNISGKSVCNNL